MRSLAISCALVLTLAGSGAFAATPEETFEKVYGGQIKKINAQRDAKATGEFVQGLIKDASDLKDDAPFQALVLIKAYEIALRAGAFPIAEEAMETLAIAQPNRRREADEKLIVALERERRPANRPKLDAAKSRLTAEKKLEQLERAVEKTANKKDAAEIVRLQLVEFDDPVKALAYAPATADPSLQRIVVLAGRDVADLPDSDAKELGDWYQSRSTAASPGGRIIALGRAKGCYERFLAAHAANDALRLEVKRRLDALAHVEAATPTVSSSASNVVDLLKLTDASADAFRGKWLRGESGLIGEGYSCKIRFPYEPPAFYDLRVVFTAHGERGRVDVAFTHDGVPLVWRMSWTDWFCEFQIHNAPGGATARTPLDKKFADGSRHEAIVRVRKGSVLVFLDGKPMGQLVGDCSKVTVDDWFFMDNHALGLLTEAGTVTFVSADLAEVSGRGKPSPKLKK